MAKKMSFESSRKKTEKSLILYMEKKGMDSKFFKDQIIQYMEFFDCLNMLNTILNEIKTRIDNGESAYEEYKKMTSEKRMIVNSMQNILTFLGLKPNSDKPPSNEETKL